MIEVDDSFLEARRREVWREGALGNRGRHADDGKHASAGLKLLEASWRQEKEGGLEGGGSGKPWGACGFTG